MKYLITFIITFLIIYFIYLIFVVFRKNKVDKIKESIYAKFLEAKGVDLTKFESKNLANTISLANTFIFSTTFTLSEFIQNIYLKIAFILPVIFLLIIITYSLLCKFINRKKD